MTLIESSAEIRKFLEIVEKTINLLMKQTGMKISTSVRIFKGEIVVFVAEKNCGYGGYVPVYEIFILKPENVDFKKLSDASVRSIQNSEIPDSSSLIFQRVIVKVPKEREADCDDILFFAHKTVCDFFGGENESGLPMITDAHLWSELVAVPEISYKLEPKKVTLRGGF